MITALKAPPGDGVSAAPTAGTVRCAIYTRKSTDEGLHQDFSSLDAPREAAEAFIASQRSQGWALIPNRYDDGGFSGANIDRPAALRRRAAGLTLSPRERVRVRGCRP